VKHVVRLVTALALIPALALAGLITQSGPRHFTSSGGGGGSQFTPNHWVSAAASGSGNGLSSSTPWTLEQAVAAANPGDQIMIMAGTYSRSGTSGALTANFTLSRAGSSGNPIIWFAENYAALTSTNRSIFQHTGTAPNGNPVFQISGAYNELYGIFIDETNAVPGQDTGTVVISAPHVKFRYNHLDRNQAYWAGYAAHGSVTNISGLRIEPYSSADVFDVEVSDNKFTNYTLDQSVNYGMAASLVYSQTVFRTWDVTYQNNTFDNVNVAVYVKGAGTARPILGAMRFINNYSCVNSNGFGVNIYHFNLSDADGTNGRNQFIGNLMVGGFFAVRPYAQTPPFDISAVDVINNTLIDAVDTNGESALVRATSQADTNLTGWRIQNNIVQAPVRMFLAGEGQGDRMVSVQDYNSRYHTTSLPSWQYTEDFGNETRSALFSRVGKDGNSDDSRNPMILSTTCGNANLGKLNSGSPDIDDGVDILNLRGGGTSAAITRGAYWAAGQTNQIGVRPLP
jgi:hypothetical protein